ncbi:uncharacterized protein LOC134033961 [Osmerus eperlanus]|uniref:uncharacterized protein LOC134033961 n=1 Tax=Osmerus eperlanus TaxID=29151 RepID=UPI002E13EBD3
MMSEAIVTFQSQLSGVMETVFKAAMYEITRLVEDSFLEEVSRSREQVESLKKRLQWSENRRRERDRRGKCSDCGRAPASGEEEEERSSSKQTGTEVGRGLKLERVQGEEWTSCGGDDRHQEAQPGTTSPVRSPESADVVNQKLDRLLKEEALNITPDNAELHDRWGVCLDGAEESDLSRPSKSFSDQDLHQCPEDWAPGLDQGRDPGPDEDPNTDPSDSMYRSRFSMEDLGGFEKSGYGGSHLLDMGGLDALPDSPPRQGGGLGYGAVGHFQGDPRGSEGAEHRHHVSHRSKSGGGAMGSPSGSPAEQGNQDVGDLNCLLINEEGYLQDPSVLYPGHGAPEAGSRAGQRGHPGASGLDNAEGLFGPPDAFPNSLGLGDRLQYQGGGRGLRKHICNQCSMVFQDSGSLRTHKLTHKPGQGPPQYSCNQCGKVFNQACNLRVHQRIHTAQGLHLCSHCGKGFSTFADLKRHKCGQTVDKPYSCSVCGNKFSRLWNLKLHRRIHTQEKPHRCTMCDKSFTRADILKVHQRTHTGERPYCCSICGLSFKRLDHLKSHQRKHRPDMQNLCVFYFYPHQVTRQHVINSSRIYLSQQLTVQPRFYSELIESNNTHTMSETLILAFQSQLSIVMETVMKTAVYEVTRLVEEGFLEEVRRRKQEVELLRLRLEWAERKLKGVSQRAKCADCGKTGLPNEELEDITSAVLLSDLEVCGLKQEEEESESRWGSCEQESESPEETVKVWQTASPLKESLTREEELKEEDDVARSSSAGHHRDTPEPEPPLQEREEEWSPAVKQDPQPSPSPPQSDALTLGAAAETLGLPSAELLQAAEHTRVSQALRFADSTQNAGRTRRGSGAACEWRRSAGGSPPWTGPSGQGGSGDERDDELLVRDQLFSSVSPRLSSPELTALSIKQEVIVEEEDGKGAFSQLSVRPVVSLNHVTQKPPGGGGMRRLGPHSKPDAGLGFPRPTQQPIRTHPRFSSPKINAASANPAPQIATPQHRNPQVSLPPQRHPQGDKRPGAVSLTRNNQWVSIKTQHPLHQHLLQGGPQPHHPHPSKVPLRCGQCGRNFPHPSNLRAHLQTHSGERPFSCSLCGRSFTKLSNLKAHRRVHTGERPYCCQACGKRFTQKCNLKRHQRIHLEHGL